MPSRFDSGLTHKKVSVPQPKGTARLQGNGKHAVITVERMRFESSGATQTKKETKEMRQNYTDTLRQMKPGDTITLPAKALAGLKSSILTRLRQEFVAEKKDWRTGAQDKETGEFTVTCYTREL